MWIFGKPAGSPSPSRATPCTASYCCLLPPTACRRSPYKHLSHISQANVAAALLRVTKAVSARSTIPVFTCLKKKIKKKNVVGVLLSINQCLVKPKKGVPFKRKQTARPRSSVVIIGVQMFSSRVLKLRGAHLADPCRKDCLGRGRSCSCA